MTSTDIVVGDGKVGVVGSAYEGVVAFDRPDFTIGDETGPGDSSTGNDFDMTDQTSRCHRLGCADRDPTGPFESESFFGDVEFHLFCQF